MTNVDMTSIRANNSGSDIGSGGDCSSSTFRRLHDFAAGAVFVAVLNEVTSAVALYSQHPKAAAIHMMWASAATMVAGAGYFALSCIADRKASRSIDAGLHGRSGRETGEPSP